MWKRATVGQNKRADWHQKKRDGVSEAGHEKKNIIPCISCSQAVKELSPLMRVVVWHRWRNFTDEILWNGHHSEWLDPFVSLLIERGRFLMSQGSRMNRRGDLLKTKIKTTLVSAFIVAYPPLCLRVAGAAQKRARNHGGLVLPPSCAPLCAGRLSVGLFQRWATDNSLSCHGKRV